MYLIDTYDVIVVGAGHAGCEAALAAARLGCKTLLTTISLENVAMMPCNPAIGGPGKSHLVKEIDALGGEMGIAADKTAIQMRMLNLGKGPAVYALRAQSDKNAYHRYMKQVVENTDGLDLKQVQVMDIIVEDGNAWALPRNSMRNTGQRRSFSAPVLTWTVKLSSATPCIPAAPMACGRPWDFQKT